MLGGALLGLHEPHLAFDIVVHAATLFATVGFYWRSLLAMVREALVGVRALVGGTAPAEILNANPELRLALLIGLGTIPTGIIGVGFKDTLESLFGEPRIAAGMLMVTAAILLATLIKRGQSEGSTRITMVQALIIGLVQGCAIVPGISRSGSTIAAAILLGVDRELAARFSFLLSLPAIAGAVILKFGDGGLGGVGLDVLGVGFVSALLVGLGSLALLIPLVRRGSFYWFAAYLVPASVAALVWLG